MCLPEIPGLLADPTAPSWGATQGGFLLVTFLCRSKKSDSRKARNAFSSDKELKSNDQSKIKGTLLNPPLRCAQGRRQKQKHKQTRKQYE